MLFWKLLIKSKENCCTRILKELNMSNVVTVKYKCAY